MSRNYKSTGNMSKNLLLLGDCLEQMESLPSGSVDAVITDPPYGKTACKWDAVIPLEPMWAQLRRVTKPNAVIALFGSEPFSSLLRMSNLSNFRYDWIWVKNLKSDNLNARKKPMTGHEIISIFCDKLGGTYNPQKRPRTTERKSGNKRNSKTSVYGRQREFYLDRQDDWINPDTVLQGIKCVHNSSGKLHPTQKPVELLEYLVRTYTNPGHTVLDFAMGSGTTGVACVRLGRDFIGIEIDEAYFSVARDRIRAEELACRNCLPGLGAQHD